MISLTGEVRKVLDHGYTNKKTGEDVAQGKLILEPEQGSQNYEVIFTAKQIAAGVRPEWEKLIGKVASVEVSIYINHEHQFHKYTAVGQAHPILESK